MKKYDYNKLGIYGLILAILLFFSINIMSVFAFKSYRIDLTQSGIYSLSKGSLEALKEIKEQINIKFFMSSKLAQASQTHSSYAIRVLELLEQYAAKSNGMIKLQVIDPQPFSKQEDEALSYGLKGLPVGNSSEYMYMGVVLSNSVDRKRIISFLDPTRERFLEYDITKYITDLTRTKRPVIGVISTLLLDGQGRPNAPLPKYYPKWAITNLMRDIFDVRFISRQTLNIPSDIDVLMIVNPKKFTEETLYAIDQYIMRGNPVVIMVDPLPESEIISGNADYMTSPDMNKLFDHWGIQLEKNHFIGDMEQARFKTKQTENQYSEIKFPPWIAVKKLNPNDPVTASLKTIHLAYPGTLAVTKETPNLEITPLLYSSSESMAYPNETALAPDLSVLNKMFKSDKKNYVFGLRIKGQLTSAFEKAPTRNFLKKRPEDHLATAVKPTNIIVVADSDLLADSHWVLTQTEDDQVYAMADNGDFVINILDNLSGAASLIDLRAKSQWNNPLKVLDDLREQSDKKYRAQERELKNELSAVQNNLRQLMLTTEQNEEKADSEELEHVYLLKQKIIELRKNLRQVQSILIQDVQDLQTKIILVNIFSVPFLLIGAALFVAWRKKTMREVHK